MATAAKLTERQQRFADEYLVDLNATAAYKRAGYATDGNSAEACASRLLRNDKVEEYIQKAMNKRAVAVQRTAEDVLRDILAVKMDATQIVSDRDGNQVMADRPAALKALELEGKHYKMFTDKTEVTGANGGPIDHSITVSFVKPAQ